MDDTTIEERLNGELNAAESKIEELKSELSNIKYEDAWKWRHIVTIEENELPIPRLEMRISEIDNYNTAVTYGLVKRHTLGHIEFVPFNSTKVGNCVGKFDDNKYFKDYLPFRDGVHIQKDMFDLKLLAFKTYKDKCCEIKITE